jgi:hypothetical protein
MMVYGGAVKAACQRTRRRSAPPAPTRQNHTPALEPSPKTKSAYTLTSMSSLALVLGRQGRYEEAKSRSRPTLSQKEKILDHEHADTLFIYCLAHRLASQHP